MTEESIAPDARALNRYVEAQHGMQSGVALKMYEEPTETSPKHLRVGVNTAMVDQAAVVKLLLDKGIFTMEEYYVALAEQMEAERDRYQAWANERYGDGQGPEVTLR